MFHTIEVASAEDERFRDLPGHPLSAEVVTRQQPGASWMMTDETGDVVARCSLWWEGTPTHSGQRVGYLGHYAVLDPQAAPPLLRLACEQLAIRGCMLAVGPVDGNTWQRYRLITERGSVPLFFLEPDNPDDWPGQFTDAGFTPLAHYYSALNDDLSIDHAYATATAQRLQEAGISLRSPVPDHFEAELRRVHALSLLSFRDNFLYTPIGEAEFLAQYTPLLAHLRPELVLLAEQQGEVVGYLLAIPDLLEARRGVKVNTAILKTMAVHPDHAGQGLGGLLMARCHEIARQAGFTRVIHALFHESNRSGRLSRHSARVFRRYTLFARPSAYRPSAVGQSR